MNAIMLSQITCRTVLLLFSAALPLACNAATFSSWRLECVGRTSVSLPTDVELAGVPYNKFAQEIAGAAMLSEAQFADGQAASWNRIQYVNGLIMISKSLDATEIEDLRSRFSKQPAKRKEYLKTLNTAGSRATVITDIKVSSPHLWAWSSDHKIAYLQQLEHHLLYTGVASRSETLTESTKIFESIAKNTSYRELFSVPSSSGVCLPFAFIKDSGVEPRAISVTYRIKSQPDVTIVLMDASAATKEATLKRRNITPEQEMDEFWAQYEASRTGKKVTYRGRLNSTRSIELDGRKGLSSFVDITRKDDSKDIGFLAKVQGNRSSNSDASEVTLFMVREANHARAKGFEPITEEAFLELAKSIASSIQIRKANPDAN